MATYSIEAAEADLDGLADKAMAGEEALIQTPRGSLVRIVGLTSDEIARLQDEPGA